MKRNKKLLVVISIVSALAVFSVSALAAVNNLSGYDKLKAAVLGSADGLDNASVTANMSVQVNGTELSGFTAHTKSDGDEASSEVSTTLSGETEHFVTYSDGQTSITVTGDEYMENFTDIIDTHGYDEITPTQMRFLEMLFDTLIGDTKNYVVSDGNNISLTLTGHQIPELAQLGVSVMAEAMNKSGEDFMLGENVKLRLGEDARIDIASMNVTLDDNGVLSAGQARLTLTGTVDGMPQTVDLLFDAEVYDIGTTVVVKPDITGKKKVSMPSSFTVGMIPGANSEVLDFEVYYVDGGITKSVSRNGVEFKFN